MELSALTIHLLFGTQALLKPLLPKPHMTRVVRLDGVSGVLKPVGQSGPASPLLPVNSTGELTHNTYIHTHPPHLCTRLSLGRAA
jgi:hypothetical protein